ncbi:MAG: glycosyltransferase family 39 protein [Candidatus Anammoxibacter sp.]
MPILVLLIDLLLLFDAGAIIFVIITGGGVYCVLGSHISVHSIEVLGYVLLALGLVRYRLRDAFPFMGLPMLPLRDLPQICRRLCANLYEQLSTIDRSGARRCIVVIILVSALIKLLSAYFSYGFFSGDDVEVHEMVFSRLFGWENWKAWEIRSAFFPMVFIYPIQATLHAFGIDGTVPLILSGRFVVIIFSLVNLILVYRIAAIEFGSRAVGLLAIFFLATGKLHTSFAASVLPRTVTSTFILLAVFFLLSRRHNTKLILAAVCLAIGSCIRFGEWTFLVPAILYLVTEKRFRDTVIFCLVYGVVCAMIFGIGDFLYWGKPFHSLIYMLNYTVVEGNSSRGFQPFYYYIKRVPVWTNIFIFGLAVLSFRIRKWHILGWAFIPILILSFLPHKEPRYLVASIPFITILAAAFFWRILENPDKKTDSKTITAKPSIHAFLIILVLVGSVLFELNGYNLKRTENDVDIARYIISRPELSGAAIEQHWRVGGMLYLWKLPTLKHILPIWIMDRNYVLKQISAEDVKWAALTDRTIRRYRYGEDLARLGYKEVKLVEKVERDMYRLYKR